MTTPLPRILSVNGGSSSIKFALYRGSGALERLFQGRIERIGQSAARLVCQRTAGGPQEDRAIPASDHTAAVQSLLQWLEVQPELAEPASLGAIGHRVVHGLQHVAPERVTPALVQALRAMALYDPEHVPGEIALMEAFTQRYPALPQVACFDTAFHAGMPREATQLALPRRLEAAGVRRYGFHGLSYAYLMEELARVGGPAAARGRVVLAHLGNGASMAAVAGGRSMDTSMGFTPASGLPMGTRAGDLDPGIAAYLAATEGMSGAQFNRMVNRASGLLGLSETSADMRDLLEHEAADVRAAEAVALFCYQAKKCVGAYAAALGGLDTLVFAGGVGENAAPVRARICAGLEFLGVELDAARNAAHAPVVSGEASRVTVRVVRTDEERMIARSTCRLLGLGTAS